MKRVLTFETISFGSCMIMMLLNIIVCFVPLNGESTNFELTKSYPNLFNPASYTCLIWIVVLISMTIVALYLLAAKYKDKKSLYPNQFYIYFILVCLTNIIWNIAWSFNYLALAVMLSVTGVIILCKMNEILAMGESKIISFSFQLYFGLLLITGVSDIMALITSIGWMESYLSEEIWTVSLITLLTAISGYLVSRYHYIFTGFAVIWAYIGMLIKHIHNSEMNTGFWYIIISIIIGIVILTGITLTKLFLFFKKQSRLKNL